MNKELDTGLERFLAAARSYCALVDTATSLSAEEFLSHVGKCLLDLYSSALWLPKVEPDSPDLHGSPFDRDVWASLYRTLRDKIGTLDMYWGVFESGEKEEPVQGSLACDISEIYSDIKEALELASRDVAGSDVLWDIRESFRHHWGRHAMSALKVIHDLRESEAID